LRYRSPKRSPGAVREVRAGLRRRPTRPKNVLEFLGGLGET